MTTHTSTGDHSSDPLDSWTRDSPPDSARFFRSPEHDRLLELIRHLVENTDNIIIVCGEEGAGKSTLLYRLQAELPEHWLFCRLDANPLMHADQMLNNLARRLQATPDGEQTPKRIAAALSALRLQGRLPLVLLDDADQLPASSLMALLRLHEQHDGDTADFALLLLSHPRIEDTLDSHQLHAMGTAHFNRLELSPLPPELTVDYVRHYLRLENAPDDIRLSPEQLARVHRRSGGLPGRINEQVIRVLHAAPRRSMRLRWRNKLSDWLSTLPPITLATAIVVLLLLGATLAFQDAINAWFESPPEAAPDSAHLSSPLPLPTMPPLASTAPEPVALAEQTPLPLGPELAEPGATPDTQTQQQAIIDEPLIPPPPEVVATPPDATTAPALVPAPTSLRAPESIEKPAAKPQPPTPAPAKAAAQPTPAKPLALRPGETWLMSQNPKRYSLQLLAAGNEAAVKRYLKQASLPGRLVYFQSQRAGKPWFTVLHGSYPSRDAAMKALKRLPAKLQQSGAWPRQLGTVQAVINQRIR